MTGKRFIWPALVVVIGSLQAWDSGVLASTTLVRALVAAAILVPSSALLLTTHYGTQAIAVAASFVLLTIARVIAPGSLPTLHLIAFVPALIVLGAQALRRPARV